MLLIWETSTVAHLGPCVMFENKNMPVFENTDSQCYMACSCTLMGMFIMSGGRLFLLSRG